MAYTVPADSTNQALVSRGSGKLYYAASTTNGADPAAFIEIGPTTGGIEIDGKRTLAKIECDQFLGPIGGFPSGEAWAVKANFIHDHLANHFALWGTLGAEAQAANILVGGTTGAPAGSLTFGESSARRYVQLLWRGPGPGDQVTRSTQIWRATAMGPGTMKFVKSKERDLGMSWEVFADPGAYSSSRGAVGLSVDA